VSEWPIPRALSEELPSVQPFAPEMLPSLLRAVAEDIAERMQVPLDYPAVALVLCLAGAVNRRARIQPKRRDTAWVVVPNLWGGIVAPPGFMKTPVLAEATRPLAKIEDQWNRDYQRAMANHPDHNGPPRKRLIVNDATHEKLHEIMRDNPAGVFAIRDELTGWIAELEAAGREGERAFYLSAWNGDTGHSVDRIKRGSIHVPACCLSLLGGIQPDRLRKFMSELSDSNLQEDGLIQRFQLLVWPDFDSQFEYVDRPPEVNAQRRLEQLYSAITKLDPQRPLKFRFGAEAQLLFVEWFEILEHRIRSGQLEPALLGHLGKYRSLMPTLATLFEIASSGFEGFEGSRGAWQVSKENAGRAIKWCTYLESHARRIYSLKPSPEQQSAIALLGKIRDRAIGPTGFFTVREAAQHEWTALKTAGQVRKAVALLMTSGWIRPTSLPVESKGGRPSSRFEVNPQVWLSSEL